MQQRPWFRFGVDPDATLALRPRRRSPVPTILAAGLLVLAAIAAGLWATRRVPSQPPPLADEAALLAAPTTHLTLWRFSAAPGIVVAIFPTLHAQAMALNRVAAFVEHPGVQRDHLPSDADLRGLVGQSDESFDTYYYGHDYRAVDLARFFAVAATDRVPLHEAETDLKARLDAAGFFNPGPQQALISLPPQGEGMLDGPARATILDHELAHGAYFTDPRYAAYVVSFWNGLTDPERSAFRHYLGQQGYDTANDDLMRNETQAYLAFTPDPRMFDIARIGLPEAATLRKAFLSAVPLDWLRRDGAER